MIFEHLEEVRIIRSYSELEKNIGPRRALCASSSRRRKAAPGSGARLPRDETMLSGELWRPHRRQIRRRNGILSGQTLFTRLTDPNRHTAATSSQDRRRDQHFFKLLCRKFHHTYRIRDISMSFFAFDFLCFLTFFHTGSNLIF